MGVGVGVGCLDFCFIKLPSSLFSIFLWGNSNALFLFVDIVHNITSNSWDSFLYLLFCFEKQIK